MLKKIICASTERLSCSYNLLDISFKIKKNKKSRTQPWMGAKKLEILKGMNTHGVGTTLPKCNALIGLIKCVGAIVKFPMD